MYLQVSSHGFINILKSISWHRAFLACNVLHAQVTTTIILILTSGFKLFLVFTIIIIPLTSGSKLLNIQYFSILLHRHNIELVTLNCSLALSVFMMWTYNTLISCDFFLISTRRKQFLTELQPKQTILLCCIRKTKHSLKGK